MSNALKDQNHTSVIIGATSTGTMPLSIDHVTDRLLIEIYTVASETGSLVANRAFKDENHANTLIGVSDDGNNNVMAVAVEPTNGYPILDLVIE